MDEAAPPPEVAVESPSSLPHPTSTDSTRSDATVKGSTINTPYAAPATPAYPFPRMKMPQGTPLLSPGIQSQFMPFTTLSPTVEPPSIKLAKAKLAQDFKASGHMDLAKGARAATSAGIIPPSPPDNLKIAIELQTEPGLQGWWNGVCKVVRENFGAERATLAVPSDITDIENVPWAQLATFRAANEDAMSKMTNDRTSNRSNLTDVSLRAKPQDLVETPTSKNVRSPLVDAEQDASPTKTTAQSLSLPSRPRLEFRHSYAGYPLTERAPQPEAKATPKRPRFDRASSSTAANDHRQLMVELNEETLEQHDQAYAGRQMEQFPPIERSLGSILDIVQPLENEADALIDGSGIFKIVHRGAPILLTRQYKELADDVQRERAAAKEALLKRGPTKVHPRARPGPGPRAKSFMAKSSLRTLQESPGKEGREAPYEDYEQIPASPWSQSPAPSPAGRAETAENPFFPPSGTVDETAFDEEIAAQSDRDQHSLDQIPAIGTDKAATIVQIPIIHPNSRISQRTRKREDRRRNTTSTLDDGKSRSNSASTASRRPEESINSTDRFKRTPVAILSILVPFVPYPMYLTNALMELSPLMATSFISARQHTNMVKRIETLSKKRRLAPGMASEISLQTEQSDMSGFFGEGGFDSPNDTHRALSPTSNGSRNGSVTSEKSRQPSTPSDASMEDPKQPTTPGFIVADAKRRVRTPGTPRTPAAAMEMNESYFVMDTTPKEQAKAESSRPKLDKQRTESTAAAAAKLATAKGELKKTEDGKRSKLHSGGATFAATHPALPTATASLAMAEAAPADMSKGGSPYASIQNHTPLQPGNNMLKTMIDNGATQQWIAAGHDGSIIWANAKFLVYRQSHGDELDNDFWDSILPKEKPAFRSEWARALQTGEQFANSCRLKRFNGQYRWFHVRIIPIKDRHGATKFFHGQAMDIHEQHEAEQSALKAKMYRTSEAKYRALANSLPVIVFAAHVPAGVTFANSQWYSYSGQEAEEALGFGFLDHVHPDDLKKCRFPGFDGGPPYGESPNTATRNPLLRHDSGASTSSSHDSDGTGFTELTARPKRSPNENPETRAGLDSDLLRQLKEDGIVMCDTDGQGNFSISTELRIKSKNGEYRWHVVSGSFMDSVNFGSGEAQWFIACTDITTQKLTEARMQDAKVALEDANSQLAQEVKSKMSHLSSMSHEIRTPLNGIIGNLQFLINTGLAEEAYEWAHGAKDAAMNMSELINDILDLSKAEANMLKLSSHSFSPREITENVLDQLNSRTAEKKLELSAEFDERVPMYVRGDSGRMRQVLLNLVNNAAKFTATGEIWISCDVMHFPPYDMPKLGEGERYVQWKVQDTGKGFTEQDKDLLFKEYSQIKRRNDKDIGGTGLGLILCKTMVELHGGRINANGELGKGATFDFFARFKLRRDRIKPKGPTSRLLEGLQQKAGALFATANASPRSPSLASVESLSPTKLIGTPFAKASLPPHMVTPGTMASVPTSPASTKGLPPSAVRLPSTSSLTSPAVSSAGSSIRSGFSAAFTRSLRSSSSISAQEVKAASMKLTLPDISDKASDAGSTSSSIPTTDTVRADADDIAHNIDAVKFRPPMYSILLYCPVENARRITAEQIQFVVPNSVPCQVTAEANLDKAMALISGDDPVNFTHVVVRTTDDAEALDFVDRIVTSYQHMHTSLVLITDQTQMRAIAEHRPEVDVRGLQQHDKLIVVQRPCHTYKLSKVFDPLKENLATIEDPLTTKRKEEKRLQKESYALFKNVLGTRKLRILAVEDNRVQMKVLTNFLGRICGLEVVCAWNGQECLDLLFNHSPMYYSVVVSDIEMPLIGGYEMVRRIRSWEEENGYPPIPTVSLSANTVREGWVASAEAGFTHYTPKPVNFRDLGHVLLEVTDPDRPHVFLRDRAVPKELSGERDESSDESDEE